jgi:acetyl esterase
MMSHGLDAHCGSIEGRTVETPSPLTSSDLTGQPPALVVIAEFDRLADEGIAYARRLEAAGVEVTPRFYGGVTHGFFG